MLVSLKAGGTGLTLLVDDSAFRDRLRGQPSAERRLEERMRAEPVATRRPGDGRARNSHARNSHAGDARARPVRPGVGDPHR